MIKLRNVRVEFKMKESIFRALDDVSLTIHKGDIYGIIGYSGAGKSTLLRTLNLLQETTGGSILYKDKDLKHFSQKEVRFHRKNMSMIFQNFNLLNQKNVLGNILFALKGSSLTKKERKERAYDLLKKVGLLEKAETYPRSLSGGQKQRVAIARALATNPEVLLCDEATSSLDPQTTEEILSLLKALAREEKLTIILITHEMEVIKSICNRVAVLDQGKLIEEGSIIDIFSEPKEVMTRHFLGTKREIPKEAYKKGYTLLELKYRGKSANKPIISAMERQGVEVNILGGSMDYLQGVLMGSLLVSIKKCLLNHALTFLEEEGVGYHLLGEEDGFH